MCKRKNKYGLSKKVFEIQRNGKAKDTNTTYSLLPEDAVKDVEGLAAAMKAAELHDLENPGGDEESTTEEKTTTKSAKKETAAQKKKRVAKEKASEKNGKSSNGKTDIDALRIALKSMPDAEDKVVEFLEEFGIKKVKDLPAKKVPAAMEWISAQAGDSDPEVDAFD